MEPDISGTAADGGTEAAVQRAQVIPLERRNARQRRARDKEQRMPDERARETVPIHVWTHEQPPVTYKNKPRAPEARMLDPIAEIRKQMKGAALEKPLFGTIKQQPQPQPLFGGDQLEPPAGQLHLKAVSSQPKPKPVSDERQRKRTTVIPFKPGREPAILWDQ
ncbi:hypothetical protein GXP70_01070 [Paenibacillus lycopersici]|uniref:Uncharacterized protein n=2 Tax=Paenibacillus lycopersici TaxID=2704462 RepID=A0A6C0FUU6_9BACL|nr:hypothetical protein GXP70_01070 [Paenibacillus lycopersici]